MTDLLGSLEQFDSVVIQCEAASQKVVDEDTKVAIIVRSLHSLGESRQNDECKKLAEHFLLEAEKFDTYSLIRMEIQR